MDKQNVLVVGCGSVGKRHASNLFDLGCSISAVDPRPDRLDELSSQLPILARYTSMSDAIREGPTYDGVVVCSPPKYHVEQAALAVNSGAHVLLEKPVTKSLADGEELLKVCKSTNVRSRPEILLGYTWRWWPALQYFKQSIDRKIIGDVYFGNIFVSANLEDWHPWEDYREFFMSSADLGGGALLDESHWIDQMIWMFGLPQTVWGRVAKISNLEITSDDSVDLLAIYGSGLSISLHLDIYGRPHKKAIEFVGESGTMSWTEKENHVIHSQFDGRSTIKTFDHERNFMFVQLAKEFISVLNGNKPTSCLLQDGLNVLRVIEAVRESDREHRLIGIQ